MEVDDEGLCVLAGQCDAAAIALLSSRSDVPRTSAGQATVAAVSRGNDTVVAAASVFAERMTANSAKLRAAAAAYVSVDNVSSKRIVAAGRSIEV